MIVVLAIIGALVPGLEMVDQPHISDRARVEARIAQIAQTVREIMEEKEEPEPWATLADCESGDWIDGGTSFVDGSARWDWPVGGVPPWGTTIHHGGLQFLPSTWSWVAPMVGLGHIEFAYQATPAEQIRVAEKIQELQGWGAWPVCSRKIGLR